MTSRQTRADQRAYLESGLRELLCAACGAQVRVKKHSELHTSVQWTVRAVRQCAEFSDRQRAGEPSALVATCVKLRDSIDRAVREGQLAISPAPVP